ncbi:MAG: aminopeptidase, partial [Clostridia bacterium]|nr:aminopeptidase [Clostridia bacterium]
MNKKALSAYAELLIKKGVNLQKGEMLVISSPLNAKPLVIEATKIAYKQGASCVEVLWRDDEISKISYKKRSMASLKEVPRWIVEQKDYFIDKRAASLVILSDDPEVLKGVNPKKVAAARRATNKALAKYREFTSSNKLRWSIGGYPNRKWAKKVFPDLTPRAAEEKLWEYIAKTVRLDCDDPIKAWDEHQKAIEKRCEILNSAKIKEFHYKSANGTDFRIAMPKGYIFCGGAEKGALDGVKFTANIPTEEVFSCPDKFSANGKLVSSMPLCRNGQIIRNFSLT